MITVCVHDDCKALEKVHITKHSTCYHSVFGVPNGESIPIQIFSLAMDFKVDLKFPISDITWL
jgi:hypothetical protein